MATPTSDAMKFYFASKYLSSDGDTITQNTADSGGTTKTIVDAALTEADDYWNGAVGWFDGNTTTTALRGVFFHVRDFEAASDTLTLAKALPAAPAAGDTYRLVLGGNFRGDTECYGMEADGDLPEQVTVTGTNITGLTIKYLSALLDEGTLSVQYDNAGDTLQIKMDSESYGATLDVSSDVNGGIIYGEDGEKYVVVDTVAASLPGSNQTDTFTTTYRKGTFVPDYEAYETSGGSNKTRYRLAVLKNEDGADTMQDVTVWCDKPAGTDTTTTTTASITAGSVTSYWLYNSTKDDVRFILNRSGNVLSFADATGGLRGKTAQTWDISDVVEVYPDFDIGLDAPSTLQFENPTDEETAPGGVTFDAPATAAAGLSIGALANADIYGVWYRETIIDGARGRDTLIFHLNAQWS